MTATLTDDSPAAGRPSTDDELSMVSAPTPETRGLRGLREKLRQLEDRAARNEIWDQLLRAISLAPNLRAAGNIAAGELQRRLGATRVAIGVTRYIRGNSRLIALSDVARFSSRSDVVRKLESAMDEAVWRREMVVWSASATDARAAHAHRQLSSALGNVTSIVTVPLMDAQGECWGAIVLVGVELPAEMAPIREFADGAAESLGAVLGLWRRASTWNVARLGHAVWAEGNRRRLGAVAAGITLLGVVLALPIPYRITCECDVQPVARRFVVAPFDSSLEKARVGPGDLVSAGQPLASLDGREIRCELATTEAEYNRAAKERDTALANGQTAAAQIARLEMEGLEIKAQLLQRREQELVIESPIDGILISGDWEKSQGARLTIGQTLFEIGTLDRMAVEIAIPEEDVRYARNGARVHVQVNAVAGQSWSGTIEKVHPRAEIRDKQNIFVAEVTLANDDRALLPGMKGTAKIQGPTRPLAWNLFHKPWNALRKWIGV